MTTNMETLDPSALSAASSAASAVTYDPRTEKVTLPNGVVSVAGITVVTGGTEMSWGCFTLAFSIWGTVIGISVVALGLWNQSNQAGGGTSNLLGLGLVILAISFGLVGGVVLYRLLTKRRREITREQREDGKVVLVGERGKNVVKKVTV